MAENSKIEWTHHTFNPWMGCDKVSPGCKFCYAESFTHRFNKVEWGKNAVRLRTKPEYWKQPLKWNAKAQGLRTRFRVFCASLADVFEDQATIDPSWRKELFELIKRTPHLDWLLLTKRPENILRFLPEDWINIKGELEYPNIWLGTSVENQEQAEKRIPILQGIPAKIKFLSCEPLLEGINFGVDDLLRSIDWVIIGGESGPKARPFPINGAKGIIYYCQQEGVAVLFKQLGTQASKMLCLQDNKGGDFDEYPKELESLKVREYPL